MADQTDYESAYEGTQMDEAFGRILGIRVGRAQIIAQSDGAGFTDVYLGQGYAGHAFFANARCTSITGNIGVINASVDYSRDPGSASGYAILRINGDGVLYGETYEVEYLVIEMTDSE